VIGTYRTQEELDAWIKRDPIDMFRKKLVGEYGVATAEELADIDARIERIVQEALEFARASPEPNSCKRPQPCLRQSNQPSRGASLADRPRKPERKVGWRPCAMASPRKCVPTATFYTLAKAQENAAAACPYEGFVGTSSAPSAWFDTPISEQGFTSTAVGASATGARTVSDLMFADFIFETAGQIFMQAAKLRYMSNGQMSAPIVVRVGAGALRSSGPHHSGSYIRCLRICRADRLRSVQSGRRQRLMKTALRAGDPVMMLEPKALFASKGEVAGRRPLRALRCCPHRATGQRPDHRFRRQQVLRSLEAAESLAGEGISCEVIDLRTIMPLDIDTIVESVRKTHRLLIVDEAWAMCAWVPKSRRP